MYAMDMYGIMRCGIDMQGLNKDGANVYAIHTCGLKAYSLNPTAKPYSLNLHPKA